MALSKHDLQTAASLCLQVYSRPTDWLIHTEGFTQWLAIEGTDELVDWRRNFEFILTSTDEHLGFGSYARELMGQMWANHVNLDPNKTTILCGHSLGGAVATIMAAALQDQLPLLELVTFGSPRPGGAKFAKRLRVPHHRYVHEDDVVPHMPLWIAGFRHTAPAIQLQPWSPLHVLHGVADHDMNTYRLLING
jgi:pimeloyl-ACP methyl ester carboxylesterase